MNGNSNGEVTPQRLMQLAWGYAPPLIIESGVRLGVFDVLERSPLCLAEVAAATGASVRGLGALLNALVGLELLRRNGDRYELTEESAAFLVSSAPASHAAFFHHVSDQLIPNWLTLTEIVRSGQPRARVNDGDGAAFFAEFVEGIFPLSFPAAWALGEHLGIPRLTARASVLDVGAGSGVWGIALARQSPHVTIHAVDWPQVLEVTRRVATRHGVADRLTLAPGNFSESDFGQNHRLATIGHILHSEGPVRSRQLLRRVFDALAPGGTVAIAEFLPNDDRTGPPTPLIFAVNMLVNTDEGDTFTFPEISQWLREAGFRNPRLFDAPSVSPLVLADKPA